MKSLLMAAALLVAPVAAMAQAPDAPAAPSAERIAAARPVIDQIWPLGTYRRMMDGTMSKMMDSMMESMMGMRASDMIGGMDPSGKAARDAGDATMAQMAEKADPHFRERMKITFDVMMGAMVPLMEQVEPTVRQNMTSIYARNFTAEQLGDMSRFFATPSGRAYAEKSMLMFTEPEMIQGMQAFVPEFMKAMPGIMKKVEAATAHLPPPPKRKGDEEAPASNDF
jgi:hypothetical protein